MVAVRDDLRHQRGVLRGDIVPDELGHVHKAHDGAVEAHPGVHRTELDIADDMVERLEEPLGRARSLDV